MSNKPSKALLAEWDRKLAEAGFEDIEDRQTGLLKEWSGNSICGFKGQSELSEAPQATYYSGVDKINKTPNTTRKSYNSLEWKVVRRHAKGMGYRAIATELGVHKSTVQYYVDKFRSKKLGIHRGTHKHRGKASK